MQSDTLTQSNDALSTTADGSSADVNSFPNPAPSVADTLEPSANFSNKETLQLIQDFLSAPKPKDISPIEVALTVALLACKAVDHTVSHSHQTLALMLGCDARTIRRAEKNLKARGYISLMCRKGLSKLTSVNLEKLPTVDPTLPKKPTADAEALVKRYATALDRYFPLLRREKHKQWYKTQAWSAQKILNRCNGNFELACKMVGHALDHPVHKKAAVKDLYKLWGRWKSVEKTFADAVLAATARTKQPIPVSAKEVIASEEQ